MTTQARPRNTDRTRTVTKQEINASWTEDERVHRRRLAASRQFRLLTLVGIFPGQDRN